MSKIFTIVHIRYIGTSRCLNLNTATFRGGHTTETGVFREHCQPSTNGDKHIHELSNWKLSHKWQPLNAVLAENFLYISQS